MLYVEVSIQCRPYMQAFTLLVDEPGFNFAQMQYSNHNLFANHFYHIEVTHIRLLTLDISKRIFIL